MQNDKILYFFKLVKKIVAYFETIYVCVCVCGQQQQLTKKR